MPLGLSVGSYRSVYGNRIVHKFGQIEDWLLFAAEFDRWCVARYSSAMQHKQLKGSPFMIHSFDDAGKLGNEIADTGLKSFASVSKNMQAIAVEATEYSRRAFEQSNSAVEKLMQANSAEGAAQIHMDFAKQVYEGFVGQATRMGALYADMAKEVYKPFETLGSKAR